MAQKSVFTDVRTASLGVLFASEPQAHRCWFARWLATAARGDQLQSAETWRRQPRCKEAVALAPSIGIPHQNLIIGDRDGHIAWTIFGRIPLAAGAARLDGSGPWTSALEHPQLTDPPSGRVWTANARPTDDPHFEALLGGDEAVIGAGYDLGARAHQIATDLAALQAPVTPADMLRVQLDDRAFFLARWRALSLELLDVQALRDHPARARIQAVARALGTDAPAPTRSATVCCVNFTTAPQGLSGGCSAAALA